MLSFKHFALSLSIAGHPPGHHNFLREMSKIFSLSSSIHKNELWPGKWFCSFLFTGSRKLFDRPFPQCLCLDTAWSRASEDILFSPFKYSIYLNLHIVSEADTLSKETEMTLESNVFFFFPTGFFKKWHINIIGT